MASCSFAGGTGYNQFSILPLLIDGELSPFINWLRPLTTYPEIIRKNINSGNRTPLELQM